MDKSGIVIDRSCAHPAERRHPELERAADRAGVERIRRELCTTTRAVSRASLLFRSGHRGSLKEIAHALDTLKADGIGLMTSYQASTWRRFIRGPSGGAPTAGRAVVYTHPLSPECCKTSERRTPASSSTRRTRPHDGEASVFSGTAARYPDIRWIFFAQRRHHALSSLRLRAPRDRHERKRPRERLPRA